MVRITHKDKAVNAWRRSNSTLTCEVTQIRQRQDAEGANNNVATIETEVQILGTYWQQASKDFAKLDNNFPEFDVDKNGEPLESKQESGYE